MTMPNDTIPVIERGVPIPPPATGHGGGRRPMISKYGFHAMRSGDSVWFPNPERRPASNTKAAQAAYGWRQKYAEGWSVHVRNENKNGVRGVRVWLVAPGDRPEWMNDA